LDKLPYIAQRGTKSYQQMIFKLHIKRINIKTVKIIDILKPKADADLINYVDEDIQEYLETNVIGDLQIGQEYIIEFVETYTTDYTDIGIEHDVLTNIISIHRVHSFFIGLCAFTFDIDISSLFCYFRQIKFLFILWTIRKFFTVLNFKHK